MKSKQLDDFLKISQDVFYSRNLIDNKYDYMSESIYDILGYTSEEFINLPIETVFSLIHPDDMKYVGDFFSNFIKSVNSKKKYSIEYRIKHKNGRYVWVHENISKIIDKNKPTHMVGNLRDVTKQKETQQQLNNQNSLLEAIIDNTSGSLWSVDKNYKFIHCNQKFRDDIKKAFNKEFKSGMNVLEDVKGTEYKKWKRYYDRALKGESYFFEHQRKYGNVGSWFEYHFSPIKSESKEIIGVTVTAFDITLRKLADNTLTESEERFRMFTNSSPVGIYTTDLDGNCNFANSSWLKMAGMTMDEAKGKGWISGLHPEDRMTISEQWYKGVESEGKWGYEYRFKDKKGKVTWVYGMAIALTNEKGKTTGYLGTNINITEIKKVEEKLNKTNKQLNELIATKDKLFSIIAHDLKNPFSSIIGFSELLVNHIKKKQYDKIEKFSGIIHQESRQSMDLLTNLLDWSRAQTGSFKYEPTNFDLSQLIEEVIELLTVSTAQKQIKLTFNKKTSHPLFADRNMIYTVLRNLITNAIKFTDIGGKIEVNTQWNNDYSTIFVHDNGVGMSKEKIDTLFKIEKTNSTRGTNDEKGTGLGLLLCKEFIDKHKGKIWVESALGKGTTFHFTIPEK